MDVYIYNVYTIRQYTISSPRKYRALRQIFMETGFRSSYVDNMAHLLTYRASVLRYRALQEIYRSSCGDNSSLENTELFCGYTGFFCRYFGFLCKCIALVCEDVGLFGSNKGPFD